MSIMARDEEEPVYMCTCDGNEDFPCDWCFYVRTREEERSEQDDTSRGGLHPAPCTNPRKCVKRCV